MSDKAALMTPDVRAGLTDFPLQFAYCKTGGGDEGLGVRLAV